MRKTSIKGTVIISSATVEAVTKALNGFLFSTRCRVDLETGNTFNGDRKLAYKVREKNSRIQIVVP